MKSDVTEIEAEIDAALKLIRAALNAEDGSPEDHAIEGLATFAAVAIRVFRKTNPSKLRSEARTVEIKARLDGVPVARGAA